MRCASLPGGSSHAVCAQLQRASVHADGAPLHRRAGQNVSLLTSDKPQAPGNAQPVEVGAGLQDARLHWALA